MIKVLTALSCLLMVITGTGFSSTKEKIQPDTSITGLSTINDTMPVIISSLEFEGNKVTKDFILYREMEFARGDTVEGNILKNRIISTRENLLNTSLFNFVTVHIETSSYNHYQLARIKIEFIERWYVWPFPIFEFADRNFNVWWKTKNFQRVNYGFFLVWENFRGRKEKLSALVRFGYEEKINFKYEVPYINKKRTIGLGAGLEWSKNHEVAYELINDTLTYFKTEDYYPMKKFSSWAEAVYRPDIHNSYLLSLKYNHYSVADTVLKLNSDFTFDNKTRLNFLSLYFKFKSDFRDFKAYPLTGYYFDLIINKYGLGILPGNNVFLFDVQSTFRKYWKLSKKWYFATLLTAQFSANEKVPYLVQRGLGFGRYFVRGYEYYVVSGQNFGFSRSNIKFALLPTRVYNIGIIPTETFSKVHFAAYLNLFFDFGYVEDNYYAENNTLSNIPLYSSGIGLDLVTYYDIILRMEYTANHLNETGFFIHFMAPI